MRSPTCAARPSCAHATPEGWIEIDSTSIDEPGPLNPPIDPYAHGAASSRDELRPMSARRVRGWRAAARREPSKSCAFYRQRADRRSASTRVIRMPSYEQVRDDPVLYAHASRILHLESNPGNARALVQRHGDVDVWLNPPPHAAHHQGDGCDLRAAVRARAASVLRQDAKIPA